MKSPAIIVFTMSPYSGAQSHSEPASHVFGASFEASAWYPTTLTPLSLASFTIVDWQSWCWVMTSTSFLMRLFAASACFDGSHHDEVATVMTSMSGFTLWAPRVKALMLEMVCGIGKA